MVTSLQDISSPFQALRPLASSQHPLSSKQVRSIDYIVVPGGQDQDSQANMEGFGESRSKSNKLSQAREKQQNFKASLKTLTN